MLYDQLVELAPEIKIVFNDAGHILGSAITELWVTEGENTSKIVFSGDLGVPHRPILRDPVKIKKADYVIMETTYGNRVHPANSTSIDELIHITLDTVKRGGSVIITVLCCRTNSGAHISVQHVLTSRILSIRAFSKM